MSLAAVDINGDDILDLLVPNGYSANASVFLGDSETITTGTDISLNLATQTNSQNLLDVLSDGLDSLLERRSAIGAQLNRLEYAKNSALINIENLSSARSRILDTDIAEETAELTRAKILQEASRSVLMQANSNLQMILELLRR